MKKGKLSQYLLSVFLLLVISTSVHAQLNDSIGYQLKQDSFLVKSAGSDKIGKHYLNASQIMDSLVRNSQLLSKLKSNTAIAKPIYKSIHYTDLLFYTLFSSVIFLGLLKSIFNRYFNNMLRVFFNTSLRQSQLTEQLLQAKLPMWMFHVFFFLVAGQYVFFVLNSQGLISLNQTSFLLTLILSFAIVYTIKSAAVFLFGWITGHSKDAQLYDFIVTLTNQLLSVVLLPVLFFIAFSDAIIQRSFLQASYFLIGISFVFRYFRAYNNIGNQMKIGTFHFIIYILGVELLPLLLIYKFAGHFLRNYL